MAKKTKNTKNIDPLAEILNAASPTQLADLVLSLAASRPDIQRESLNFLKERVSIPEKLQRQSEGEIALALWYDLEPDLNELDDCGGGDEATEDSVADLLYDIQEQLDSKNVESDYRREILDEVLPYIKSGNAGMDDMLYKVAYAACYDDFDLRKLAEAFEAMRDEWKLDHARRIYRRIGDRGKYLELRMRRMKCGGDYHDLATFYWESGEGEKALEVAEEGLKRGEGRMDELRMFVADRAKKGGDRKKYMALQFAQATDHLTLETYRAFKKICTAAEWELFEPQVLAQMKNAWRGEQLKIRIHRKEYPEAVAILSKGRYPTWDWDGADEIRAAKELEKRYPEEVLTYYLSGLGSLTGNAPRKEYARKARVMAKMRHVIVEVLGDEARWRKFAAKIKQDNIRRPAFQEEFAHVLPDWQELK